MTNEEKKKKGIERDEYFGRWVASKILKDIYKEQNIHYTITQQHIDDNCDMVINKYDENGKCTPIAVEVKMRYKNEKQKLKYPACELKLGKYYWMKKFTYSNKIDRDNLYYIVMHPYLDEYFIFKMEEKKDQLYNYTIWRNNKQCENDENSKTYNVPIYQIPTDTCIMSGSSITHYCEDYINKCIKKGREDMIPQQMKMMMK